MPGYTFHTLSDVDFEELVSDLVGAAVGLHFQSFTPGRDNGIDLLHGARLDGSTVVQCKHFWRSGFSKLASTIKRKELHKVRELAPSRYVLATSVGLTPKNKQNLADMLAPFCQGVHDIYGCDDLNALLRAHPEIETRHHKLWLTSEPVLRRILQHGHAVWNTLTQSEIERRLSLYVQTSAFEAALDVLNKHNYCILSGIPGIGKTSLAQMLVTQLLETGFELIAVRDDVQEAFDQLDLSKRQIVYYDDFLGRSSLGDHLGKNEDRGLLRLLQEAERSKVLKVIFTTREYILVDAQRQHELLTESEFELAKCVVKVEDYTRRRRARILYNHLYFSALPREYVLELAKGRNYRRIVDHPNYIPRIVEWMTSPTGALGSSAKAYPCAFEEALNDPLQVWGHAFNHQITSDARLLLYCLASVDEHIRLSELELAWAAGGRQGAHEPVSRGESERFMSALRHLDGSFIRTETLTETGVMFYNPSIRDFVLRRFAADLRLYCQFLERAPFFEQVSCLARLDEGGRILPNPTKRRDTYELRDSVRRTLCAPPAVLYLIVYRADGERRLVQRPLDLGYRLSLLASWTETLGTEWLDFVCETATLKLGENARLGTVDACGFLEVAVAHYPSPTSKWSALLKALFDMIGDVVDDSVRPEGWRKWSRLIRHNEALVGKAYLEKWFHRAVGYCSSEFDTILGNAETESEARDWFDELSSVASIWNIGFDSEKQALERWIEDRASEDQSRVLEPLRSQKPQIEPEAMDAELDKLFRSLTERDWPGEAGDRVRQ